MKHSVMGLAAGLGVALLASAPAAMGSIYGSGEGYYYMAFAPSPGSTSGYVYTKVGPFETQDACWQARNADFGNGDSWLPFEGTNIKCVWIFHNELDAFNDALSDWNSVAGGGNTPPGGLGVEQLEAIADLQRLHAIERYKRDLSNLLRSPQ